MGNTQSSSLPNYFKSIINALCVCTVGSVHAGNVLYVSVFLHTSHFPAKRLSIPWKSAHALNQGLIYCFVDFLGLRK